MNKIEMIEKEQMRIDLPDFKAGDTVKVHVKIKEGDKVVIYGDLDALRPQFQRG